ncbi:MAG: efflux RND transporter periplasmic adaptor subunit [Acidobacteria bacterium]|nr:efflux RND transporter periplasmic adaptor subunit [Acidobacteriota bacterium]
MRNLLLAYLAKILLITSIALALSFSGCKSDYSALSKTTKPTSEKPPAKKVKLVAVSEQPIENAISLTGNLVAYDQATISAKVPGRLKEITIDLGKTVKKGQLIAQIDPQDYQLRLQQAEAALAQARTRLGLTIDGTDEPRDPKQISLVRQAQTLVDEAKLKQERSSTLLKQGIISQADFDAAETAYKVAVNRYEDALEEFNNRRALLIQRRSELEIARQQIIDTAIYAPFDGVVQEKQASLGEFLSASSPIATIVRIDPLRLRVEVPERDSNQVKVGQKVKLTVEGDSSTYTGQVMRLSPTVTEKNRMLLVEAEIANNGTLRPGTFAQAQIVVNEHYMVKAVPKSAVVTFAGIEKVIMVTEGKAVEKNISTGQQIGENIEVTGLKAGEEVVLEPGNLQSGQAVELIK